MPYLDTRDLEKRREELQGEKETLEAALVNAETTVQETENEATMSRLYAATHDLQDWIEENQEELDELTDLSEEIYEWEDGATLIPEDEFTEYCQELLEDIGDLPRDLPHYIVIDWEATADNLKADYSEVEYQGVTYLVRSY